MLNYLIRVFLMLFLMAALQIAANARLCLLAVDDGIAFQANPDTKIISNLIDNRTPFLQLSRRRFIRCFGFAWSGFAFYSDIAYIKSHLY